MKNRIYLLLLFLITLFCIGNVEVKAEMEQSSEDPYTYFEGLEMSSLSLGLYHSSAITSTGEVFTWGSNSYGQLGDGTKTEKIVKTEITSQFNLLVGEKVEMLNLGFYHSSAITSIGRTFIWGSNGYGQLGDGTTKDKLLPTEITSQFDLEDDEKVSGISLGYSHSSAITSKGRVFTWGSNANGQLGDGTTTNRLVPTEITSQFNLVGEEKINKLNMGSNHSSAITSLGRVFLWGYNKYGQLGDGTITNRLVPTDITNQFYLNTEEKIVKLSFKEL